MKELKKKTLKSVIWIVLLCWGIAVAIGCTSVPSIMNALSTPIPIEEVDFTGDFEGTYVSVYLYGIYDWYCEEETNSTITAREYLIDADDYYYIGLRAEGDDMSDADALMEASWAYMDGEDDGTILEMYMYEVTGVIREMPTDSREFYYDYVGWYDLDTVTQDMFLPYYVEIGKYGNYDMDDIIISSIFVVVLFGVGLFILIRALTGGYQQEVKKYIANSGNPDMTRERVEHFFASTPEVNGLRYNREFISGQFNGGTTFGEMSKLAWVYLHTTEHKRYFITVSKSYALVLGFADGKRYSVNMKKEEIAKQHMMNLSEICPQTIFGYSDDLDKLFRRDLAGFLNLRYNAAQMNDNNGLNM